MQLSIYSKRYATGYVWILPAMIIVAVLGAYPFLYSLILSFTDKRVGTAANFIGLNNYISLVQNATFRKVIKNSAVFTISAVGLKVLIGLGVALVLRWRFVGRKLVRMLILLPWAAPKVVVILTWRWMLDDIGGVINYLLKVFGIISKPVSWLGSVKFAMPAVIATNVWRGFPFFALCLLAALEAIPEELYDAAKIDGAGRMQRFWNVTMPNIKKTAFTVILLSTIWTFNDFQTVFILTMGGPANATHVVGTYTYEVAFLSNWLGTGVAISTFSTPFFVVLIFLIGGLFNLGKERS